MKKLIVLAVTLFPVLAIQAQEIISTKMEPGGFPVVANAHATSLYVDDNDDWLVKKAAAFLQADVLQVTGSKPDTLHALPSSAKNLIIIGTLDGSPLIRSLVEQKKIDVSQLKGKWETFKLQMVDHPCKGVDNAFVIVGSDKRGAAYGVFELSQQMGVSPWYWWADVPVKKKPEVFLKKGAHLYGPPSVKYRGIFINDEAPAFSGWTKEKFGGVNHNVYEKMFELILRMKGNFLWPAMWGNAFNDDDKLNPVLANQYGIVMSTSHHEPMLRAQQEWKRYGKGEWNYATNDTILRNFWRKGIENMGNHESIVTVGMRGDGDKPMTQGSNVELLERIVADQRKIIADVTCKPASATPQVWALYKEVQDYYDKGMRVPDDVTLLLCDDNWGDIRKLPKSSEKNRPGGYGIYYHFDYVGGPRNYKWLNTNSIPRVWEQMHLAYEYGVDRIWVVNVGDLKPMEYPIDFFLDYAWDTKKWNANNLGQYTKHWAAEQFGDSHATAIADIVSKYTSYNARRKPELLTPATYSLVNYNEAETVVNDYNKLLQQAEALNKLMPAEYKDAYYQLVLHPVQACANLNQLYLNAAKNSWYAAQGRAATNDFADSVKALFIKDSLISKYYNTTLSGGKWSHMMDQTHIGYVIWQEPRRNAMPALKNIVVPDAADMGVAIEGSTAWWPKETTEAVLPGFTVSQPKHYIEVFNRGQASFDYKATSGAAWVHITTPTKLQKEQKLWISVDWQKAPAGTQRVPITIAGPDGKSLVVTAVITRATGQEKGFAESNGYISIEAEHYSRAVAASPISWERIPGLGRTLSAMTVLPVTATPVVPGGNSPRLEYDVFITDTGKIKVDAYFSPTLDFKTKEGLSYGISIDNETPQIIHLDIEKTNRTWEQSVGDNIRIMVSEHQVKKPGAHVLKFWMADPGVVLQKIVLDMGGVKQSYLGPPETIAYKKP